MIRPLLLSTGLCFLSVGLLIPMIPRFVTGPLGQGTGAVGACLATAAVTAVLARPLAGRLADRWGRATAARAGGVVLASATFALLLADSLPALLACRAVAGVGEALAYVGLATAASDQDRPGAAMNLFSVAVNVGLLAGPALAETVYSAAGFDAVWVLAGATATGMAAASWMLGGCAEPAGRRSGGPLVHRAALLPGLAYLAGVWGYTAFSAFIPLYVATLGHGGSGTHFLVYGGVLLAVRLGGHRLVARTDPRTRGLASLALTAAGLIGLAVWPSVTGTLCASAVIGAGQALGLPAFLAIAVAGLPPGQRGAAVATTTAFFDLGFLTAALALGVIAESLGLASGFAIAGGVSAMALLLFIPIARRARDLSPSGGSLDHHPR
ncbi:MFS transporter [Nonomuraea sp. NPDC048916]|uniref:MFS transporter n=1 Tax=Nonomuraea sp. NPDC048916 TaxID=3154232 RepID=UPI0033F53677